MPGPILGLGGTEGYSSKQDRQNTHATGGDK